jgi:hypothetical protein
MRIAAAALAVHTQRVTCGWRRCCVVHAVGGEWEQNSILRFARWEVTMTPLLQSSEWLLHHTATTSGCVNYTRGISMTVPPAWSWMIRLTPDEMTRRCEGGLCFNCHEKFSREHLKQCSMKGIYLLLWAFRITQNIRLGLSGGIVMIVFLMANPPAWLQP